jgi:D-alanyl-lipoteichoic acid acyltransferase DltB (MBOAT superfamily)
MNRIYAGAVILSLFYLLLSRFALSLAQAKRRFQLLAGLNLIFLFGISVLLAGRLSGTAVVLLLCYLLFVLGHFFLLRISDRQPSRHLLALAYPVACLIFLRYLLPALAGRFNLSNAASAEFGLLIGISFMAFRLVRLSVDVRNGIAACPTLAEHTAFAFYAPTLAVGPISPYLLFASGVRRRDFNPATWIALKRIIIGACKFIFLSAIFARLSYPGLLSDGHPHGVVDLLVAGSSYYLFLYCNFSGFCDVVIGWSALMGIPLMENFDSPFRACNIKEFWNHWHITLSVLVRDLVFTPCSKWLIARFGPRSTNHAIAASILLAFLVIGLWHGKEWGYLAFGLMHGLGVVAGHYYTVWMRFRLGRLRFQTYNRNPLVNAGARMVTFLYVSASFVFFPKYPLGFRLVLNGLRQGLGI